MENKFRYALFLEVAVERGWGSRDIEDGGYIIETDHHITEGSIEVYAQSAAEQIFTHKLQSSGKRINKDFPYKEDFPYKDDADAIDKLIEGIAYFAKGKYVYYENAVYPVQIDGILMYHHTFEEETI